MIAAFRAALLAACFTVACVVVLAATAVPASAHAGGVHDPALPAATDSDQEKAQNADTCCHKAGTCVVQFLPASPAVTSLDVAPTALEHSFAAVRRGSVSSATDPPPPRP